MVTAQCPFAYVNQYMQGNPTVAYLTQKVDLPIDHNTTLPRPSFNNLRYSLNPNDNENRFLTLNLFGNISHKAKPYYFYFNNVHLQELW